MYTIYTDGSSLGNPGPSGWAAYIVELDKEVSGGIPFATNNEAEMTAVLFGIGEIPNGSEAVVVTDSQDVIGWLGRGWKIKSNPRIAELKTAINSVIFGKKLSVSLRKAKGHAADPNNNRVDQAARRQAKLVKPVLEEKTTLRLVLDIYGLNMDDVPAILRTFDSLGGHTSGEIELLNQNLEVIRTKTV